MRRISIYKERRIIDTYTLTFNKLTIPTSIRIGYINTRIETYVLNPLRPPKCQKYGHPRYNCTRPPICTKCGKGNHTDLECKNPFNYINCIGEHPCILTGMWNVEKRKNNNRNKIRKKHLLSRGLKNSETNTRTTQLCIYNKKREQGKGRYKMKTRRTEQTD